MLYKTWEKKYIWNAPIYSCTQALSHQDRQFSCHRDLAQIFTDVAPPSSFHTKKLHDVIQDQFFLSFRLKGDVRISLMKRLGLKYLFEIRIIKHSAALNGTISPNNTSAPGPQYENSKMVNIYSRAVSSSFLFTFISLIRTYKFNAQI